MRKKKGVAKRIISLILCMLLTIQIPGQYAKIYGTTVSANESPAESVSANEVEPETASQATILDTMGNQVDVRFEADFAVDAQWENAYNAKITISNTSDETIENWALSFQTGDKLSSFYNATVAAEKDGVYQIKNCGWNRDIAPGERVTFGFTGSCKENISVPTEFKMLSVLQRVDEGAEIKWTLGSAWADGYTGEMSITNTGKENLEDWRLTFLPEAEIVNLWNATLIRKEENNYTVRSNNYNSVIEPGQTVTFGFQAKGEWEQVPTPQILLFEQNTIEQISEHNPEEEIAQEFEALEIIYAENDNRYAVTEDVILPENGVWGGSITWESSEEGLVSAKGLVTRPDSSREVTLTATIHNRDCTMQKEFTLRVIKKEVQEQKKEVSYEELLAWNEGGQLEMYSSDGGETLSHINGRFTAQKVETEQEAINAVWGVAHWMGADEETDSFRLYRRISNEDGTVYRMSQYYKGIKVFGGDLILATDAEGYADYLSTGFRKGIDAEVEPMLSEERIQEILEGIYSDVVLEGSELLLYDSGDGCRLSWSLDAVLDGTGYDVLMDDATGEVMRVEDGVMTATTTEIYNMDGSMTAQGVRLTDADRESGTYAGYEGEYVAADISRKIYVYDAKQSTEITGHKIAQSDSEKFADDVVFYSLRNFAKAYDYYKNKIGWISYNGLSGDINVYANIRDEIDEEWENAAYVPKNNNFWIGSGKNGGFAKGIDVLAHEYTHGVMRAMVPSEFDSGDAKAVSEAYADIMGGIIEAISEGKEEWWIYGDTYKGMNGSRNLKNPSINAHPSVYKGQYWYAPHKTKNEISNYCHINSTVIGHVAYQIQQELGLSLDETAQLWFWSMPLILQGREEIQAEEDGRGIDYFSKVREAVIEKAGKMSCCEGHISTIGEIFDRAGIPDTRAAFAPGTETTGYNYLIKGIVVKKDATETTEDNPVLHGYEVVLYKGNDTEVEYTGESFLIKTNRTGQLTMRVKKAGYVSETVTLTIEKGNLNYDLGYIELGLDDISVECRVCDAFSTEEIEGMKLSLRKGRNGSESGVIAKAETDENGMCRWEGLQAGTYCIEVVDEREENKDGDVYPYPKQSYNIRVIGNEKTEEEIVLLTRPEYMREFDGKMYQLFGASLTWEGAEQYCESIGGHLVCIGGSEENDFLMQWLQEEAMDYASIGFTDRDLEGYWMWIYEEEGPIFTSWNTGEPNNGLNIYKYQNHAYLYNYGKWDDGDDTLKHPFFCEWESEEEE